CLRPSRMPPVRQVFTMPAPSPSAESIDQAESDPDSFIRLGCPSVAAHQYFVCRTRCRGNQGIVRRSAADANFDKARNESAVIGGSEFNVAIGEPSGQEVPHQV